VTRQTLALLLAVPLSAATLKIRLQPSVTTTTVEMPLETYVAAALAGEASVLQSDEALKAMAVAARTYAIYYRGRHAAEGYDLCGTTHCQRLDPAAVTPRIQAAVEATLGELLWYQGKPAFACYSRNCGGVTEDAAAVWPALAAPYLRSHPDPYCTPSPWQWSPNPADIVKALRGSQLQTPPEIRRIEIAQRTASGRARVLVLTGSGAPVRISAGAFRFAMGRELGWNLVRSDRFEVQGLNFQGTGEGHGVGLCQRGADQMGVQGRGYRDILAFYYPGTVTGLTGRGLPWTRLAGETIALMTTHPDTDRGVLDMAGRELRAAVQRTNLPAPARIEIRLYPDVETFRNATGEPGSVAAYTVGNRIQMQPLKTPRQTLRHELLHVLVETQAKEGLPIWFREGLVSYLEQNRQTTKNDGLSQLVNRYGEATVLGWLKTGLPRDVTNSSASAAAPKSK
jgi:stage II sporulation protein D